MRKLVMLLSLVAVMASCSSKKEYMVRMFTTAGVVDVKLCDETPEHRDNIRNILNGTLSVNIHSSAMRPMILP